MSLYNLRPGVDQAHGHQHVVEELEEDQPGHLLQNSSPAFLIDEQEFLVGTIWGF